MSHEAKSFILAKAVETTVGEATAEADRFLKMSRIKNAFCSEVAIQSWSEASAVYNISEENLTKFQGIY